LARILNGQFIISSILGMIVCGSILNGQYVTPKNGWFPFATPFPDTTVNPTHIGRFTLDPPAGHHGKVLTSADGHLYFQDGTRAKFFGTNACFSATYPQQTTAANAAAHIAKQGFNMMRFHHLDDALTSAPGSNTSRRLNHEVLDKLDYYFARLKERGIYSAIDLYSIRRFKSGDGIPYYDSLNRSMNMIKRVFMFYQPAYALFRDYPDSLLSHLNPYTGLAYKNEPALVFINPMNEGTLVDHYFWNEWDNPSSEYYLPRFYKIELQNQWNDWLYNKYYWDTTLIRAWSGDTSAGQNLIINGEFSDTANGIPTSWFFNLFSGNATWGVQNAGLSTEPAVFINVTNPGQYSWHIQLGQNRMRIVTDSTYRIQFRAKATRNRPLDIVVQRDRTPWNVYFNTTISITTLPQTFVIPFYVSVSDTVQLTFNAGSDTGRVWIDAVQFRRAPFSKVLDPGESLSTRTIKLINWGNRYNYSPYRLFDQIRFFYDKERNFYNRIIALLRDTLHVNSLITSSYFWSSQLHQRAWVDIVDVVDAHPYFDHPSFPNQPWDTLDFRITNQYFGQNGYGEWVFTGANQCASTQKPMILTEWQHANPNESKYVSLVPFSGYNALRGYDGIINFAIGHSEVSYTNNRIRPFFDSSGQPVHFVLLRMAALAFLRDVAPEDLERTPWQSYSPEVLLRDIYAGAYWQKAITSSPRDRPFSQFYWNSQKAVFILKTKNSKAFTGGTAADTALLGGIKVIGGDDGAFVASGIDSGINYTTFLVAALARGENTNMVWREATKTQGMMNWGASPCLVESVTYYSYWRADSLRISKLNAYGNPLTGSVIIGSNHETYWPIKTGIDSMPWYRVIAYGYQDSIIYISEEDRQAIKDDWHGYVFSKGRCIYFMKLPAGSKLKIYSVDGRMVFLNKHPPIAPIYQVKNLAMGVYFYSIETSHIKVQGKVVVVN